MEAKCFMHNQVSSLRNICCAPESWRKLHWALLSSFKRDFWWNHVFCFLLTSKISAYFKFRSKAVFPPGVKEAENTSTFFLTVLESSRNPPAVYIFKKKIYIFFAGQKINLPWKTSPFNWEAINNILFKAFLWIKYWSGQGFWRVLKQML